MITALKAVNLLDSYVIEGLVQLEGYKLFIHILSHLSFCLCNYCCCILKELSSSSIAALVWADILTGYAMFVMMTYLTNVWGLTITHAATIVNVFNGVATIMPIGMGFLVDTFMGDYWMLLLSSIAYSFVGFQNSLISYVFLLPCY